MHSSDRKEPFKIKTAATGIQERKQQIVSILVNEFLLIVPKLTATNVSIWFFTMLALSFNNKNPNMGITEHHTQYCNKYL